MKKSLVAAVLFAMPVFAFASSESIGPLNFQMSPAIEMDEKGNFDKCGYFFDVVPNKSNWNTGLRVVIWKVEGNEYFVKTVLLKKAEITSAWKPHYNLVRWAKLGNAEPIEVSPYGLIGNTAEGSSYSSVVKSSDFNPFVELENPTANIWVQVFDKVDTKAFTYFGVVKTDKENVSLVNQCLDGMNKNEKK